jgi:hypothetical protein
VSQRAIERRRTFRYPCEGEVLLCSPDEPRLEIRGVLSDVSAEGFRATHHGVGLSAGQRVQFRHAFDEGTATVMWTQVLGHKAQSGFLVGEGKR